jgi:Phosphopantetheine attachment site
MAQRGSANIKLLTDVIEDNTPSEDPTSSLLHPFSRTAIQDQLQSTVLGIVSSILGREVANDEPLVAAGLDSLGSVELRNTLQVRFRLRSLDLCMNDYCIPGFSRFCQ